MMILNRFGRPKQVAPAAPQLPMQPLARRLRFAAPVAFIAAVALLALIRHQSDAAFGSRWHPSGLPGGTVHSLLIQQGTGAAQYAATETGLYRSTDGTPWERVLNARSLWSVVDVTSGAIAAGANDGNVYVSRDGGHTWRNSLVNSGGVFALYPLPGDGNTILAGAQGGIYRSRDGGAHWARMLVLRNSAVAAFTRIGRTATLVAGAVAGSPGGAVNTYASTDGGTTWHRFGRALRSTGGVMSLTSTAVGRVMAGTMGNAVWSVSGSGTRWIKSDTGFPAGVVHVAALLSGLPGRRDVWAGTLGQGVLRSTDGGRHWNDISSGLPVNARIVLSLAYDAGSKTMYAGTADGLYALP